MNRTAVYHLKKWLFVGTSIILLGAGGWYVLFGRHHNIPHRQANPQATIKNLPAQSTSNSGEKHPITPNSINQGTATDNHGVVVNPPTDDPSKWAQSQSGVVTVKQPLSGATIKSGVTLSGSSSVGQLQYRLTDDQVGVISQGFISVVGGTFSASVNFQPHGNSGRLDVFSINQNGAEINEVQLLVKF